MKYMFYLPLLNKEIIIRAKDEATAVWKLLQRYRLVESYIDGFKIKEVS